jgi:TonB family protein
MITRSTALALFLNLAAAPLPGTAAVAQDSGSSAPLPAESCIIYRSAGGDNYSLVNNCAYTVAVRWCAAASGSECGPASGWPSAEVVASGTIPATFRAAQVIDLFACRSPASFVFEGNGSARCQLATLTELPLLLASSLKNPASIITASDYPRNVRAQGTARFEMTVDAEGRPQSCTITASAGDDALDKATCNAFMKRARFTPAKDSVGQAVAGRYRGSVTWKEP